MTYPQDPNNPYGQPGYGQQYPSGGYPQPGYGLYGYPGGPLRPKDGPGLAIGALICSIVGIFLCFLISVGGIIMGHIAYGKAKRGEAEGQGVAMAAFIVGYVAIGLNILALIFIFGIGVTGSFYR